MMVLIVGMLVIAAALVIRLNAPTAPALPVLPATVVLPAGEAARAVTFGEGWIAVVTTDGAGREHIRVFDTASGAARAGIEIINTD